MNKQEYLTNFEELTTKMLEITKAKNADYTGGVRDREHLRKLGFVPAYMILNF